MIEIREPEHHVLWLHESMPIVDLGPADVLFRHGRRVIVTVIRVDGTADELLVLAGRRGQVFATVNRCPHLGRMLDDATVHGHLLTCPGHGRSFDLRTGTPDRSGANPLRVVRAWMQNGNVLVEAGLSCEQASSRGTPARLIGHWRRWLTRRH